jgi:hypothetical protein
MGNRNSSPRKSSLVISDECLLEKKKGKVNIVAAEGRRSNEKWIRFTVMRSERTNWE